MSSTPPLVILADDDPRYQALLAGAFAEAGVNVRIESVASGRELLAYLQSRSAQGPKQAMPRMILLDLALPDLQGAGAIADLKADPALRCIPIIVFTDSECDRDVHEAYDLGANAYIIKPASVNMLTRSMQGLAAFWINTVRVVGDGD